MNPRDLSSDLLDSPESRMHINDEATLLEACKFLRDAADRLNRAATETSRTIVDPTGAKAHIDKIRDELTKAHELIDAADGDLTEVSDKIKRCNHPKEGWKPCDAYWLCTTCGDIWTGLKWIGHVDEPKKD